jgi:hypothetical protein
MPEEALAAFDEREFVSMSLSLNLIFHVGTCLCDLKFRDLTSYLHGSNFGESTRIVMFVFTFTPSRSACLRPVFVGEPNCFGANYIV